MGETNTDLDSVFEEIGEFGRHQIITIVLLFVLNLLSGSSTVNFIISTATLDYRCKVPECEVGANIRTLPYNQTWLSNAIPLKNDKFESCVRFAPRNSAAIETGQCDGNLFDTKSKIECSEFVYASDERNLQTELNIHCADEYKLALVGTMGNIARFIFLPLTGLICDRYGRLPGIVIGSQLAFMFAVIKSFSVNYMYVMCEFLEAAGLTFCFTGINVFAIELLSKKYRVFGNTIMFLAFAMGEIGLGIVAMYVHDFRSVLRIFSVPGLLIFLYFWILPESFRWQLATGRIDRAIDTLKRIAKCNGHELSERSIELIRTQYSSISLNGKQPVDGEEGKNVAAPSVFELFGSVLKSRRLCLRFLSCCYQFIACTFCYYGLGQSSTQINGANRYISFIIVMAIEIPANVIAQVLLDRCKRKVLLLSTYILGAVSVIAISFIGNSTEYSWAVILCFVIGKASISIAFITIYLHTSEQFPTQIRNTIMNTCSMIGRIGSMVAPFVVILGAHFGSLPALLFGASTIVAAITIVLNAETFAKKLPDTIEEAEQM